MYSEENEQLAEQAYNRFRDDHDSTLPEWAALYPKHIWRDLVQTFEANPRSHGAVANAMEQCVSDVINEKAAGAIPQPAKKFKEKVAPVETEPEKKPAKAIKK